MKANAALAVCVGLLAVGASRADDTTTVREVETALGKLNDAFTKHDADTIRRLMTDDHWAVTPCYGRLDVAGQIKTLPDLKLTEYAAGKMTVQLLGDGAALITYSLAQKGTFQGKPLAAKSFVSAVWVRKDGTWKEAHYQETAVEDR